MPHTDNLSEIQENILLTIWKLRGIGNNRVDETKIRNELSNLPANDELESALRTLQVQGFLGSELEGDHPTFSLTPLGVAILRKTEEDRLQELK
jgi:predicted transcriptional regulator